MTTNNKEYIGTVLSPPSTSRIKAQLLGDYERGRVFEGKFVTVTRKSDDTKILGRISQILPYNQFYNAGDSWTEARRRGYEIPVGISRAYEIIDVDLLRELGKGFEVNVPPLPGDPVSELDEDRDFDLIFGENLKEKLTIPFGHLPGYPRVIVPLLVGNLPMHMAVFGTTGSGKSFNTGVFLQEISRIAYQNRRLAYPTIILDAHGDYTAFVKHYQLQKTEIDFPYDKYLRFGNVRRLVFPRKAASTLSTYDHPIGLDLEALGIKNLAETIILFHRGSLSGADQQINGLESGLNNALGDVTRENLNDLFVSDTKFEDLIESIEGLNQRVVHSSSKFAIIRAVRTFRNEIEKDLRLLSTDSFLKKENWINDTIRNHELLVFDYSSDGAPGVSPNAKQLVGAYLATRLFKKFIEYSISGKRKNILFIIEEAQEFCPSKTYSESGQITHRILSQIATQGRKFGLSLCLVSQRPGFLDPIVVSMCNTFIVQRISFEDISFVLKVTGGLPDAVKNRLTNLKTGSAIVTGQMVPTPFPLAVVIPNRDRIVAHETGTVDVLKGLLDEDD
ncbi:MAG: ATP-binding protein [Candidatus Odinarchaeota archaeon]